MIEKDDWGGAVEVDGPIEPLAERACQGDNCLDSFVPEFYKERRCKRCRKNKVPYKDPTAPF